ncbi:MAG: hypothetical protein JSS35_09255 [Proteobacteria bacterium]|nr:hypothetical protein [Pseudomonadota bacterium]
MRRLAIYALAAALCLPALPHAQGGLDPKPAVWRGVAFGPEQAMEGDFTVNIQISTFHADGAPKGQDDWLAGWQDRPGDDGGIVRRYHIRFVGRRAAARGQYGPGGAYGGEVLIDRLVSARLLIGGG